MISKEKIEALRESYHLFVDIQMEKYFKENNKNEFDNKTEAEFVVNKIMHKWNTKISPDAEIDNLDKADKIKLFNSIKIDFKNDNKTIKNRPKEKSGPTNIFVPGEKNSEKDLEKFIPYSILVLDKLGYKFERLREIFLKKDEPSPVEQELIVWALMIVSLFYKTVISKSNKEKEAKLRKVLRMLEEKLSPEDTQKALEDLQYHFKRDLLK